LHAANKRHFDLVQEQWRANRAMLGMAVVTVARILWLIKQNKANGQTKRDRNAGGNFMAGIKTLYLSIFPPALWNLSESISVSAANAS